MISICNSFIHWSHKYYLKPNYVLGSYTRCWRYRCKISIPEFSEGFIISLVLGKTIE